MSTDNTFRRFTHQPLTVEHYGTTVSIKENGTVVLHRPVSSEEADEIEVPASLIIRVARLLKDTRKINGVQS